MQVSHKTLAYRIIPFIPIVETDSSQFTPTLLKDLVVTYKTVQRKSLYLVLIEFQNVGNTSIELDDFESEGISIDFGTGTQAIGASIKIKNIVSEVPMVDNQNILIDKFVSRPEDLITLRVFLETEPNIESIKISGFTLRRIDHPNEKNKRNVEMVRNILYITTIILFIISIIVLLTLHLTKINVWILLTLLTILSLLYFCFITIKIFNAIFINLTKQHKI